MSCLRSETGWLGGGRRYGVVEQVLGGGVQGTANGLHRLHTPTNHDTLWPERSTRIITQPSC